MSGEELKNHLLKHGYTLSEVAKLLGTPQQNFSQTLNKTFDIKSGLLENLAMAEEANTDSRPVPKYMYDELKEEAYSYRDQINELQSQIRQMQKDKTSHGSSKKEVS